MPNTPQDQKQPDVGTFELDGLKPPQDPRDTFTWTAYIAALHPGTVKMRAATEPERREWHRQVRVYSWSQRYDGTCSLALAPEPLTALGPEAPVVPPVVLAPRRRVAALGRGTPATTA